MGRKPEIMNGDDEHQQQQQQQQNADDTSNFNENLRTNHDEDDPLIHDTILPHRKRIRKDTFQYNPTSSSSSASSSSQNSDVSRFSFSSLFVKHKI